MSDRDSMPDPVNGMSDPERVDLEDLRLNTNDTRPLEEEEADSERAARCRDRERVDMENQGLSSNDRRPLAEVGEADSEWATRCWEGKCCTTRRILCLVASLIVAAGITIFLVIYLPNRGFYSEGAVASDVGVCSDMGRDILDEKHGHAVDAAITTLLCLGVVRPESSGLGGGMFMLIYDRKTGDKKVVMARGRAPAAATADMKVTKYSYEEATIPGELSGMWEAHKMYGRVSWKNLSQPVISLAENGFIVTRHLAMALQMRYGKMTPDPRKQPKYAPIVAKFTNEKINPDDFSWKKEGDTVYASALAKTLQAIAKNGVSELQTGETAQQLAKEIQDNEGGIITAKDLAGYQAEVREATTFSIGGGMTVLTTPSPSGGPVMQFIINVLRNYGISSANFTSTDEKIKLFHRYIEASKFAFALRSYLGDTSEVQEVLKELQSRENATKVFSKIRDSQVTYPCAEGYGAVISKASHLGDATHISVVDKIGNAVAATSSINGYFGTTIMSDVTGLILNNDMDDFDKPVDKPGNSANYIGPGKMPLSAMSPLIVINKNGDVELVAGSSGGNAIIPTNALVVLRSLFTDASLTEIVNDKRIYNQLQPDNYDNYEYDFSKDVIDGLVQMQHVMKKERESDIMSVVQAIRRVDGGWRAYSDPRKQGQAAGY